MVSAMLMAIAAVCITGNEISRENIALKTKLESNKHAYTLLLTELETKAGCREVRVNQLLSKYKPLTLEELGYNF